MNEVQTNEADFGIKTFLLPLLLLREVLKVMNHQQRMYSTFSLEKQVDLLSFLFAFADSLLYEDSEHHE